MAEPNPKREKMDNPNGRSSSSRPEERKVEGKGKLINTETQDFDVIRNMRGFVDHTHFIQSFLLEDDPKLAIFAPRRFGKSSHLNMVKMFLQIDVDQITGEASSSVNGPAKGRKNYKVFDGTRVITNYHHKDLVEDHLGKHPVIHLDLKKPSIHSVEEAREHWRTAVHRAYREHPYLKTSKKLEPGDKEANAVCQNICKRWGDVKQFKKQNMRCCLENLSEFLCNHFNGAKVYILVDEFDAINVSALREVRGNSKRDTVEKLEDICNILAEILAPVTKGGEAHVAGALITGVSSAPRLRYSSGLNNFTRFLFLEGDHIFPSDKGFVPFYGATEVEVRSLVEKLVQDDQLESFKGKEKFHNGQHKLDVDKIMLDVESRYNGYLDKKGTRIFCLWSVLQYLESGTPDNFWNETDGIDGNLGNIFRSAAIAKDVLKLMQGKTITFRRRTKVYIEDLFELQKMITEESKEAICTHAFNFMMDQGYVSYTKREDKFKMPNPEIRAAFSQVLHKVLIEWNLDVESCAEVINELPKHENEETLQKQMLAIHKKLNYNLKMLRSKNPDHVNEITIMCALYGVMDKSCSFEIPLDSHLKVDGKPISSGRPDFLLLHKSSNFCVLWELKLNKIGKDDTKRKNRTSKYALQEARGKEPTTEKKFKDYMKTIEALKLDALVIGLSVDGNFNVSLSYASNNEQKIFCITEKEKELHPAYYSDCIMLSEEGSDCDGDT